MASSKPLKRAEDATPNGQHEYHVPVLLNEAVNALQIRADGVYVDCTFGGGGHSREILRHLGPKGKLIAFDQDPEAAAQLPTDDRIVFVPHNFRHLSRFLRLHGIEEIDGLLADLGVSSHQFDEAARGFSTRFEGPLDMRMSPNQSRTAAQILQTYQREQLQNMFGQYGEVTNAKTLAATIVNARATHAFDTIADFKHAIAGVVKGNPHKYFAQVFQALRIEVNEELVVLKEMLEQLPKVLRKGARVAIISFHSLEDRMVKNFFRKGNFEEEDLNPFATGKPFSALLVITKKPITASAEELKKNPRSRSAKLRVAEKI